MCEIIEIYSQTCKQSLLQGVTEHGFYRKVVFITRCLKSACIIEYSKIFPWGCITPFRLYSDS